MKKLKYIFISILIIFFMIISVHIVVYNFIKNEPFVYKNITQDLIGLSIPELEKKLGMKHTVSFIEKGFIGFPFKKSNGKGYSLTFYLDKNNKTNFIVNKVFYTYDETKFLEKEATILNNGAWLRIRVHPFIEQQFYKNK
ncbi:hypothetical protein [Phocoenobacter skyensis]|uniref:Uncharacterized protein n=1 Tax=Phocoenobacter skyensis TaxID=97481 RepID=A0A1H7ZPR0_9PAST|nr:hypothetical protein [Pasteurella skyensis]MDP8079900.1 hypothetical protein [Pasteurella skyensis]MDP8085778.1 hypothetical protein [Pasteurella skyensis]MDP8171498.1 hypothetical protein [Pasteurella skyensis]MDP8175721.1 hypothetical protein [Pasteurella skyensis]MDP8185999.1 hypothetical protein [Pasteurella skyensis]